MKNIKVLLIAVFLLATGSSFQTLNAQDKTKALNDKEAKLQESIDQQKKAMTEQKKAMEGANKELKEAQEEIERNSKDFDVQFDDNGPGTSVRVYNKRGGARAYAGDQPFVIASHSGDWGTGFSFGGNEEGTSWQFSKTVKENTFNHDYSFDVEKSVNSVVMSVMGDCKAGDIHIKIIMPNGKSYSDIVLDEFGNLNWRKSFNISETENQDKTGEWKFQIASNKATGFFKISLQTY